MRAILGTAPMHTDEKLSLTKFVAFTRSGAKSLRSKLSTERERGDGTVRWRLLKGLTANDACLNLEAIAIRSPARERTRGFRQQATYSCR